MNRLLELSAELREKIARLEAMGKQEQEVTYHKPRPSVKVSELPAEEQARVIYWYAHPKRNV